MIGDKSASTMAFDVIFTLALIFFGDIRMSRSRRFHLGQMVIISRRDFSGERPAIKVHQSRF